VLTSHPSRTGSLFQLFAFSNKPAEREPANSGLQSE
jgi:hypothetical protein